MNIHAEPVKTKVEAAAIQTDVTHTESSNQASKDHDTELSTSIHSLPIEMMAIIFHHLSCRDRARAASVCSQWRDIVDIRSIWKNFCPIICVDSLTSKQIKKMEQRNIIKVKICSCRSVERLTSFFHALPCLKSVSFLFPSSFHGLSSAEKTLPGIEHLTISHPDMFPGLLESFLRPMVNLQNLRLNCLPSRSIFRALNHAKHLVSIHVKCPEDAEWTDRTRMGHLHPVFSLKRLTLENMHAGPLCLDFISSLYPNLDTLHIEVPTDVSSDGLENLKDLRNLKVRSGSCQYEWMNDLDIKLPELKTLSLQGDARIGNECLQSISQMPLLHYLRVPIRDQEIKGLDALAQGCPALKTLCLSDGKPFINEGLHVVQYMSLLQELILENCSVNDDFWRESSESFSKLKRLSFISCQNLSQHCLPHFSKMASLEKLSFIECMTTNNEPERGLGSMGTFKALTSLTLAGNGIENECFLELSKNTPCLSRLTILSCHNLTEDGLAAAVSKLKNLKVMRTDISAKTRRILKDIHLHLQFYYELLPCIDNLANETRFPCQALL